MRQNYGIKIDTYYPTTLCIEKEHLKMKILRDDDLSGIIIGNIRINETNLKFILLHKQKLLKI